MLEIAPIDITFRTIGLMALVSVFFWVTSLAHRMDPRVLQTKLLGLAGASLIAAIVWFAGTPSARTLAWHGWGVLIASLALASFVYASQAMKTGSVIRWAAPLVTVVAVIISLFYDFVRGTTSSDWTIAFMIAMVLSTFCGHLLRARRNKALLSANHRTNQQTILEQQREEEIRADERLRITQDLHDGLGSQLVSSLALAENGQCSQEQMKEILQSCLDDLRLTLEANGVAREDFSVALANLRYRYEPRLKAAGVEIALWDVKSLPIDFHIPTQDITPLLRIVQEAISNIIKHSRAKHVSFTFTKEHDTLEILIEDDGIGLDPTKPGKGMGLSGMQKRAYSLGADLVVINRKKMGTSICVRYRLSHIATQH